jgi:DnaJ domain
MYGKINYGLEILTGNFRIIFNAYSPHFTTAEIFSDPASRDFFQKRSAYYRDGQLRWDLLEEKSYGADLKFTYHYKQRITPAIGFYFDFDKDTRKIYGGMMLGLAVQFKPWLGSNTKVTYDTVRGFLFTAGLSLSLGSYNVINQTAHGSLWQPIDRHVAPFLVSSLSEYSTSYGPDSSSSGASGSEEYVPRSVFFSADEISSAYSFFNADPGMSNADLKRLYRQKSLALHPDRYPNATSAEQQALTEAFQQLQSHWNALKYARGFP